MTPQRRDRNLVRVQRITGVIAGMALAATGLFAGLAASKARGSASAPALSTTTTRTTTQDDTTTQQQRQQTPAVVVTPQQQAPVASSGGS